MSAPRPRRTLADYSNFGLNAVDLAAPGGQSPGGRVLSTYPYSTPPLATDTFTAATLGPLWLTGGTPPTWARVNEPPFGPSLADSPGGNYQNNANNFARWGPFDLSGETGCQIRYRLDLQAQANDVLHVESSIVPGGGAGFIEIGQVTGNGTADITHEIPTVTNETYLRFRFTSDASNTADGANIDTVQILCLDQTFNFLNGTSMATPHVAGAAALLQAQVPGAPATQLREWLLDGVDMKPALSGVVATGGRLNLDRSMDGALGVDIHRPQSFVFSGPPFSSPATTATFGFGADEAATFKCSIDGNPFVSCTSPQTYTGLALGSHSFAVFATDTNGNTDLTPATYPFTVAQPSAAPPRGQKCKKPKKKGKKKKKKCVKA